MHVKPGIVNPIDTPFPISNFPFPGLYIHVPFCKTKCPYCDFYSITDISLMDAWLASLEKEMIFCKTDFTAFDSLYLGGGTPSLLGIQQMKRLMDTLGRHFRFLPDTEITLEANPDDITAAKLEKLRSIGVNRLSIGIQSFNEEELAFLGRRHSAASARKALRLARPSGFTNFSVDLMYGFPVQTEESWLQTLNQAMEFEPAHVSCYQFTLEETTPYGRLKAEGKLESLSEEEERRFFLLTSQFLKQQGYIHYEVSNFAKGKKYRSRHNRKYWQHVPYLGLGPTAHSFQDNVRWWNYRSVEAYCQRLREGEKPAEDAEELSPEQLRLERLYLGFRTEEGVAVSDACKGAAANTTLSQLKRAGVVKVKKGRIIPTRKGFLIADRLPLMFAG